MDVQLRWRRRARFLTLAVFLGAGVVACGEDLKGGAACPVLCPGQDVTVLDTTFEAIALDTTIAGFPALGVDASLPLVARGDTVDVRAVVRFDSLPSTFTQNSGDSAIRVVDSSYVVFVVRDSLTSVRGQVRIDAYDVDTTAADTSLAGVRPLFRTDRIVGGATFDSAAVKDSIRVPISNAFILTKVSQKARVRLGFRVRSVAGNQPITVDLGSIDGGESPFLRFDPTPGDTALKELTVSPLSKTPVGEEAIATDLTDYGVVFAAPPPPSDGTLSIGGLPARRGYLRFDIPSRILDSATVLRATLLLTQRPNRQVASKDSIYLDPHYTTAGSALTDLYRSSVLISAASFDSLKVAPSDSGVRSFEVATALRIWGVATDFPSQRAIVLRSRREGVSAAEFLFFSREAPAGLRPRLRINYARRSSFGIP